MRDTNAQRYLEIKTHGTVIQLERRQALPFAPSQLPVKEKFAAKGAAQALLAFGKLVNYVLTETAETSAAAASAKAGHRDMQRGDGKALKAFPDNQKLNIGLSAGMLKYSWRLRYGGDGAREREYQRTGMGEEETREIQALVYVCKVFHMILLVDVWMVSK
ncbi:hypothetical protein CYLTODRAFT_414471 [Cylindrobasidium torrendii FP15055 ss-10]|uniref:Uncharacterized protein n=1 Tax=Cylindrobasidium torrendii FP15055 ss-10 TaxID=1314674 RepID=A0A0D7AZX1_9AGAR|nr:hypothetical protein CYLTODRAFT_414471 [Cylindrobasidium torrendii FP15055 ss-10]